MKVMKSRNQGKTVEELFFLRWFYQSVHFYIVDGKIDLEAMKNKYRRISTQMPEGY